MLVALKLSDARVAREPGGGIAGGPGRTTGHLIALGIGLAFAGIDAAQGHGPVDITLDETDRDFLADA